MVVCFFRLSVASVPPFFCFSSLFSRFLLVLVVHAAANSEVLEDALSQNKRTRMAATTRQLGERDIKETQWGREEGEGSGLSLYSISDDQNTTHKSKQKSDFANDGKHRQEEETVQFAQNSALTSITSNSHCEPNQSKPYSQTCTYKNGCLAFPLTPLSSYAIAVP